MDLLFVVCLFRLFSTKELRGQECIMMSWFCAEVLTPFACHNVVDSIPAGRQDIICILPFLSVTAMLWEATACGEAVPRGWCGWCPHVSSPVSDCRIWELQGLSCRRAHRGKLLGRCLGYLPPMNRWISSTLKSWRITMMGLYIEFSNHRITKTSSSSAPTFSIGGTSFLHVHLVQLAPKPSDIIVIVRYSISKISAIIKG